MAIWAHWHLHRKGERARQKCFHQDFSKINMIWIWIYSEVPWDPVRCHQIPYYVLAGSSDVMSIKISSHPITCHHFLLAQKYEYTETENRSLKHCKNCECCTVSLLIVRSPWSPFSIVRNFHKLLWNQSQHMLCLISSVSISMSSSLPFSLSPKFYIRMSG